MLSPNEYENKEIYLEHTKDNRPDKVHLGLVQLSTDHTMETDLHTLLGNDGMLFSSRVAYSSSLTPEALAQISEGISESASLIAQGLPMDVMAFGCTSASIVIGHEKIKKLLTINNPGIPTTNPWLAALESFKQLKVKRVSVFSPYPTTVNYLLYQQLSESGFKVPTVGALRIQNDTEITKISYTSMLEGAKKIVKNAPTDALFMSCTNLRAVDHLYSLEKEIGIPVITSNQAMFWHAMTLAGKQPKLDGFGVLLAG